MAVKVGELYGELKLDKSHYDKGLDKAEQDSKTWGQRIGGILGGAGKAALLWGGAAAGAGAAGAFMLANVAGDLNETISKTKVVFGDNADAVLAWGKDAAKGMGMSTNQALTARATLGNLFVAMGTGKKATADMSGGLVELGADLASFNNMDPTEVMEKLRAGLVGETEPLRSLGVNLTAASVEAKAMEMGLGTLGEELTPAAKAQAAYALIMEQTTTAQGDFARTSDGLANQQRITTATFQDSLATIGQAFVPIFEKIMPMVTEVLTNFGDWVTDHMPEIEAVITTVTDIIGQAFTFLAETVIPFLIETFTQAGPAVGDVINGIIERITWFTQNILPGIIEVLGMVIEWVVANMPLISSIFETVFNTIMPLLEALWPVVMAIAKVLLPVLGVAFTIVLKVIDTVFKLISAIILAWIDIVRSAVGTAITLWNGLSAAWRTITGAIGKVLGDLSKTFTSIWDGIVATVRGAWDSVSSAIKGGINTVISLINGVLRFMNDIRVEIPSVSIPGTDVKVGGGAFDPFSMAMIPRLAVGARGFAGGLAMVGEQGPELVRLPRGSDVFTAADTRAIGAGRMEVIVRDPDRGLARGGYSQADVERAITEGVRGLLSGARHAGART
jgi:phage-related protein